LTTTGFQLLLALRAPSLASMIFEELEKLEWMNKEKLAWRPGT
jgi:hypothetical protein